jgi:cyclopropane-fatty-acyl-phospholipid synthase
MSVTVAAYSPSDFYEKIVLDMLSRMSSGSLSLELPGGKMISIGNGHGGVSASVRINSNEFFKRCVLYGDIGFGEAYVDGLWDTNNVGNVIKWFLINIENSPGISGSKSKTFALNILKFFNKLSHFKRANTVDGSRKNISEHYDLNNDFFSLFLDPSMTYSSAYFKEEGMSLQAAQLAKYDRLCKLLRLKPTDHVLEIGSGWGGNAIHMARNYGCYVTTVTISEEQYKFAKQRVEEEGLGDKIIVALKDYRFIEGKFDKIVSIEMLEAVGADYYDAYFKKCDELLKKDGILAFQVITCPDSRFESLRTGVDWIQKHIFPGSLLPSVAALNRAVNNTTELTMVDLKDMGVDYGKTLAIWREKFNERLKEVKALGFDDRFIRKWNYYLEYCEAAFEMRNINVMQMVYTRPNNLNW